MGGHAELVPTRLRLLRNDMLVRAGSRVRDVLFMVLWVVCVGVEECMRLMRPGDA